MTEGTHTNVDAAWHRRELVAGASALFGALDADAIAALEREADWIDLKRGGVLVRQGDEGDRAFVLLAGRLQAARDAADGTSIVVGDIAAGETVGEMSLFTGGKRSATVRAVRDSLLIGLPRANEGRRLRAPLTNIAIVPLDDRVPAAAFCQQLSAALAAFGPRQAGRLAHLPQEVAS